MAARVKHAVLCVVFGISLSGSGLVACGGSSSETPFPQSSKEMPPDFRVTRPKTPGIASSARPSPFPPPGAGE